MQDYKFKDVCRISELINEYFTDKENMNIINLYKLLSYFYDIKIEDIDYLDYVNSSTNKHFTKIIDIPTEEVIQEMHSEGHGRDFSWWTQNYQVYIKALSNEFEPIKEEYTSEEIKSLITKEQVCILYPYRKETKKSIKNISNIINNYLVKYSRKVLNADNEYFDYMVYKALSVIKTENLINEIRIFITRLKIESTVIDLQFEEESEIEKIKKAIADELITLYNIKEKDKIKTSTVEIVIDYLKKLPNKEEWYQELTLDHIINTFNLIDEEKEKELCKKIEELVISLNEVELCYEMAKNFDWINKNKMAEIVIVDRNPYFNYYFATEVEGADSERHKQVILNSIHYDDYILEKAKSLTLTK